MEAMRFLLVKYGENQEKGLIWDGRFKEWCNNNPNAPTSKFTSIYENLNPRPKDYPFKDWLLTKESTSLWHDQKSKEEERRKLEINIEEYEPPMVHIETFEVKRYSFDTGQSFICVTKELMDALPIGTKNGSRFRDMIRKEVDSGRRIYRQTFLIFFVLFQGCHITKKKFADTIRFQKFKRFLDKKKGFKELKLQVHFSTMLQASLYPKETEQVDGNVNKNLPDQYDIDFGEEGLAICFAAEARCCNLSLEDKALLTGGDCNIPYFQVLGYEDWTGAMADINEDGFCVYLYSMQLLLSLKT
ncbi:hypothetical protein Tco_1043292 [Tanacetum coccineum]|uniref:Uncharacterized protein n=1 Tax=Tanacetum coccineum TaxID=301880 RepID=A0ABQ5GNU1_9ASTR